MFKAVIFDLGNTLVHQDDWEHPRLFPFAVEVLTNLKNRYKLGLITNAGPETKREHVIEILEKAGLLDFFEHVLVSSELGYNKPDPRIFQKMFAAMNVSARECIMIGNTISTDIFGGNRMGMETVLIQPDEKYHPSDWENPDHRITSLKELIHVLEEHEKE